MWGVFDVTHSFPSPRTKRGWQPRYFPHFLAPCAVPGTLQVRHPRRSHRWKVGRMQNGQLRFLFPGIPRPPQVRESGQKQEPRKYEWNVAASEWVSDHGKFGKQSVLKSRHVGLAEKAWFLSLSPCYVKAKNIELEVVLAGLPPFQKTWGNQLVRRKDLFCHCFRGLWSIGPIALGLCEAIYCGGSTR